MLGWYEDAVESDPSSSGRDCSTRALCRGPDGEAGIDLTTSVPPSASRMSRSRRRVARWTSVGRDSLVVVFIAAGVGVTRPPSPDCCTVADWLPSADDCVDEVPSVSSSSKHRLVSDTIVVAAVAAYKLLDAVDGASADPTKLPKEL